jgi:hypothetical protein
MASIKTPVIVSIALILALLTYLTSAQEEHHISQLAPENAPASLPDYAPLSDNVSIGDLEPLQSSMPKKAITSKVNCADGGGASGLYPGQSSGYGGSWGGQMGGSTGSLGGMQYSAAGSSSTVVSTVALSVVLLATGLVYF